MGRTCPLSTSFPRLAYREFKLEARNFLELSRASLPKPNDGDAAASSAEGDQAPRQRRIAHRHSWARTSRSHFWRKADSQSA